MSASNDLTDHCSDPKPFAYGGGWQYIFTFETVEPHIVARGDFNHECGFKFVDHVDSAGLVAYPVHKNFVHTVVPLQDILPHLSLQMGCKIARLHHIVIGSHVAKSDFIHYFDGHNCVSCTLYSSVFQVVESKIQKDRNRKRAVRLNLNKKAALADDINKKIRKSENMHDEKTLNIESVNLLKSDLNKQLDLEPTIEPTEFPPTPVDNDLSHKIISDFCAESSPSVLNESGCAVCGRLYPIKQLTRLKAIKNMLTVLHVSGITRIERSKAVQPIQELKGPVLDYRCNQVCDDCRKNLRKGKIPRHALANGLWLGAVPPELSCLSFVERLLIVHVRINSCLSVLHHLG